MIRPLTQALIRGTIRRCTINHISVGPSPAVMTGSARRLLVQPQEQPGAWAGRQVTVHTIIKSLLQQHFLLRGWPKVL